ncbi:MAG: helix-turn-helix domain-containing protein [Acidobacteriaceae bacterium]
MARKAVPHHRSGCPVSISLEVFGDRWSLLIVRDLMVRGFQRFQDFVESGEGIATNILADRLRRLQCTGVVEAEQDPEDGRRVNYRLTQKGIDLAPVMLELLIWGAQHEQTGAPAQLVAHMAANRESILNETLRRWKDRDPTPILPWLGGPRRNGTKDGKP